MNVLDENIIESQRQLLISWRFRVRQIGYDIARKGILDEQIIPFLHQHRRPTFFTCDLGFYDRRLCHAQYCLAGLAVRPHEVARYVRRLLRHPQFRTRAQRMGTVIRVSSAGLELWRLHQNDEIFYSWDA